MRKPVDEKELVELSKVVKTLKSLNFYHYSIYPLYSDIIVSVPIINQSEVVVTDENREHLEMLNIRELISKIPCFTNKNYSESEFEMLFSVKSPDTEKGRLNAILLALRIDDKWMPVS